jgi:hypothetical protein
VVVRIGNGSTALSNAAFPGFLDEYTTAGVFVQSIPLPTTDAAPNFKITFSGSATSEGSLTLSPNVSYLALAGYWSDVGTASVVSTTGNRVIVLVNQNGDINSSTQIDGYSGNNIRGAVTSDGTSFWTSGATSTITTTGGTRWTTLGATSGGIQISSTITDTRVVNIINGQLYVSSNAASFMGISSVGTGIPTISGQTTTLLLISASGSPSPFGFDINYDGTICYVGDDRNSKGGLQKWTYSDGTWTLAYTLTAGLTIGTNGLRHIAVNWSGTNPVIYATTTDAYPNKIVVVTDAGAGSSFSTLLTAATNTAVKGIAFTPSSILPVELSSFNAIHFRNNILLKWQTATEINNNGFNVERSIDKINWNNLGFVKGNGNSNSTKNYSFTDNYSLSVKSYYRLKQVDNDGKFKYSNIIEVSGTVLSYVLSQNFPNPFNPSTNISYSLPVGSNVKLTVFNTIGQVIEILENGYKEPGSYNVMFDASKLSSGIYFYTLQARSLENNDNFMRTNKMILIK